MSTEDIQKKQVDAINRHDAKAFAAQYVAGAVAYDPQYPEPLRGRDEIQKDIEAFLEAFPDLQARLVSLLPHGNTVASEVELSGTHKGPMAGPTGPIAATNRRVQLRVAQFDRMEGSVITETRRYYDMAGLMQQLGLP
jgi:predicted ester cyclase